MYIYIGICIYIYIYTSTNDFYENGLMLPAHARWVFYSMVILLKRMMKWGTLPGSNMAMENGTLK